MNNLLTEITDIVTKACLHFEHGDEEYTYGAARQILTKAREAVEGINSIDYPYGADFKRAVIKALESN